MLRTCTVETNQSTSRVLVPDNCRLGAAVGPEGNCEFNVWAPHVENVSVRLVNQNQTVPLKPEGHGYYRALIPAVRAGDRYFYVLNQKQERADPASRYQPEGVFGPSQVVDLADIQWHDSDWHGVELSDYVLYELHVGTYTQSGTFEAVIDHLPRLRDLGITALELMPVAQFSGARNWGYDGVLPFAVQNSYGGPKGLQNLVDACHQHGLAVVLDVVYNHLGPEGNFLADFGPYFTERYQTPWGSAVNFDGEYSDEVVRYFVENALSWLEDYHIDALRLDAIHGIVDRNAQPFLALLSAATDNLARRSNRRVYLIAESDLNDARFVRPLDQGGYGLHAQWSDDFHHALHALQTGERNGYYEDFGSIEDLGRAVEDGYVYTGQYSAYRKRRQGNVPSGIRKSQFVVCSQNHDQVGNRMLGERTSTLVSFESQKLSAACVLLSPYLPLLFMGEEYGETAPFLYFTSHSDPSLAEAVRIGRRAEFAHFFNEGEVPDPQSTTTFERSKLNHQLLEDPQHKILWDFYRELIRLRNSVPALHHTESSTLVSFVDQPQQCLFLRRKDGAGEVFIAFNFGDRTANSSATTTGPPWHMLLDSADTKWMGLGSKLDDSLITSELKVFLQPKSCCVLQSTLANGSPGRVDESALRHGF
jgi:maltooligosyltrehalose trehalohydrolase